MIWLKLSNENAINLGHLVDSVDMGKLDNLVDIHDSNTGITVQKLPNDIAMNRGMFFFVYISN